MALGDGIRRNIAAVDPSERVLLRDALIAINRQFFPGVRTDPIPGGVSWWFKQDEIHQATHVHGGPEFVPWHREIVNRIEAMLRQINPKLSLHYWDWTQDPRAIPNANLGGGSTGILNLFTPDFMGYGGLSSAPIGEPWLTAGYYVPGANPHRDASGNPADPPNTVVRFVSGSPASAAGDIAIANAADFPSMRGLLEMVHNDMHGFVSMGGQHISFRDPFVFLLHSNVDRLYARWQTDPAHPERLVPNSVYGAESGDARLNSDIKPWSGVPATTRPWAPPENQQVAKNYKHPSVVTPPLYDTNQHAGPSWRWANQGKPGGVNISGPEGVLTVMDSPTAIQRPYAFVLGSDENLWVNWWNGSQWNWANQSKPAGVNIAGPVGVLTVMDSPTSIQRPYAFVQGSDGNLWVNWWNGSQWNWANQGKPAGVNIAGPVGVLTVMDTPTAAQRPYTFVRGSDGNLWLNWWNGSQWHWSNQGKPAGVSISGPEGVLTVMDTPASAQRPYAFVQGSDGNLWVNWWNGSQWNWANQGKPAGVNIAGPVGVLTVMDSPASAQRPYAFVLGSDSHLWVNWWNGSQWHWSDQGKPAGVNIGGPVGMVTVKDAPAAAQRPYAFVQGSDGNLWVNWWNGSQWNWSNQGKPAGVNISGPEGVLTVMDSPASFQRPYAFVRGSDGNLWVNWWG